MKITLNNAADLLSKNNRILVLSHRAPDGDTLGCASALCLALERMGKQARFACSDEIDAKYQFMFADVAFLQVEEAFEPELIVSVDIADVKLLGEALSCYADRVDICIDHHKSNGDFARYSYVDVLAASTGEIVYELLRVMQVDIDAKMAASLYTAVSTDTGCFKYPNTTSRTLRIAADLMDTGIDAAGINRQMFDTLSRSRLELEKLALETLQYWLEGRCVTMEITRGMMEQAGAKGGDLDGLSGLPRQIDGALVGVTIRERKDGGYKLSLRGQPPVDCALICEQFGGGGHKGAAGCAFDEGTMEEIKQKMMAAVGQHLQALGLLEPAEGDS